MIYLCLHCLILSKLNTLNIYQFVFYIQEQKILYFFYLLLNEIFNQVVPYLQDVYLVSFHLQQNKKLEQVLLVGEIRQIQGSFKINWQLNLGTQIIGKSSAMDISKKDQTKTERQAAGSDGYFQTQYQNQKKLKNLFYIKSKHTKKYYQNHSHFKMSAQVPDTNQQQQQNKYLGSTKQQKSKNITNQQKLKTQITLEPYKKRQIHGNNEFVSYPTQFGLQNIYRYLHGRSFFNKSQQRAGFKTRINQSLASKTKQCINKCSKTEGYHGEDQSSRGKYMKVADAQQTKLYNNTNHNTQITTVHPRNPKFNHNQPIENLQIKLSVLRINEKKNSVNLDRSKITNRLPQSMSVHESQSSHKAIFNTPVEEVKYSLHVPAKFQICFIYGKRIKSISQVPYRQIQFNILPFLTSTFVKCKIHFDQMTQQQFQTIKMFILKVLQLKRKPQKYNIIDIINIGAINGVIRFLQQFSPKDREWIETVRYFFMVQQKKVLDYQLDKIKEELARLISIKFDAEFGEKQLFLFNIDKYTQVLSLYDLLKGGRYLIDEDPNVLSAYQNIQSQQVEQRSLHSKIKKWKSISTCQPVNQSLINRIECIKSDASKSYQSSNGSLLKRVVLSTDKELAEQRFNRLFQQFKVRRVKKMAKNILTTPKVVVLKSNSNNPFVERSKLKKEQDIFQ